MNKFYQWLVRYLPKKLIYFATIQLGAKTTTGEHSKTVVPDLTLMEAVTRYWDDNNLE